MIRPHAKSFTYTPAELLEMESSIKDFRAAGADGFVFGVLEPAAAHSEIQIDVEASTRLVRAAGVKPCTFHRAFDCIPTAAMAAQLEVLVGCGFAAVLSSGGARTAGEGRGREVLRGLVEAAGERIDVVVGGGVRVGNVGELRRATGARWFHSSAIVDGGELASGEEVRGLMEAIDS